MVGWGIPPRLGLAPFRQAARLPLSEALSEALSMGERERGPPAHRSSQVLIHDESLSRTRQTFALWDVRIPVAYATIIRMNHSALYRLSLFRYLPPLLTARPQSAPKRLSECHGAMTCHNFRRTIDRWPARVSGQHFASTLAPVLSRYAGAVSRRGEPVSGGASPKTCTPPEALERRRERIDRRREGPQNLHVEPRCLRPRLSHPRR